MERSGSGIIWRKNITPSGIFFNGAQWCRETFNYFRLRYLRNKPHYADRKNDFCVLDGSAIEKNKDSVFSGLVQSVYSNKAKAVVNGFYLLGASVITETGLKYFLDFNLFFSENWKSTTDAWKAFAQKVAQETNAWIFILDSGFKGAYFCSYLFLQLKRHFLVRIDASQKILIQNNLLRLTTGKKHRGRKSKFSNHTPLKISDCLCERNAITFSRGKLWVLRNALIQSWLGEFTKEVQVVVFHENGRKNPMVLVTSANTEAIEENWEYYHFVQMYYKRWSIEMLFKELKSWFCFENFRLQSLESIEKFLHIIIFCHTLLTIFLDVINQIPELRRCVCDFLKRTRNIKKKLTVIGLKLFCETFYLGQSFIPSASHSLAIYPKSLFLLL